MIVSTTVAGVGGLGAAGESLHPPRLTAISVIAAKCDLVLTIDGETYRLDELTYWPWWESPFEFMVNVKVQLISEQSFQSLTISEFNPLGSTYLQLDDIIYSRTAAPVGNGPPAWLNIPPALPDGSVQGKP